MATGSVVTLQHKRGPEGNMPTLASGELYFSTDTTRFWVGTDSGINILIAPQVQQGLPVPTLCLPTL